MHVVFASIVVLALVAFARAQTCLQILSGSNQASKFLANVDVLTGRLLGSAVPGLPLVTVFVPYDNSYTTAATLAQLQYGIVVGDALNHNATFGSSTADGTVLRTYYTEYGLGQTGAFPGTSLGPNSTQIVKIRTTGPQGSGFSVFGSPTQAPFKILSADNACSNGVIHWYNAMGGSILTPPGNIQTVLHNLNAFDFIPGSNNSFDGMTEAIDLLDGGSGNVWLQMNAIQGMVILLPTSGALAAFKVRGGAGVSGYIFGAGGKADFSAILLYHFLLCPGVNTLYTPILYRTAASNGNKYNFTTVLGAAISTAAPPFPLEISLVNVGITNSFYASSYAIQTTPQTVGGTAFGAPMFVDLPFSGGVIHGLNGFLLPTAVQLTLDKIVSGVQTGTFGVSKFISFMTAAGLYNQLQDITIQNTLYVPSDDAFAVAFAKYPSLGTNATLLKDVLLLHIVPGIVATTVGTAGACPVGTYATSYGGGLGVVVATLLNATVQPVMLSAGSSAGHIQLQLVSVAQNGMVYPIDTVLVMPGVPLQPTPTATATPSVTVTPTATPSATAAPTTTTTATPTSVASTVTGSFFGLVVALVFIFA